MPRQLNFLVNVFALASHGCSNQYSTSDCL